MNRATRIVLGYEPNPHPEPRVSPTAFLRLGTIYTNEEHLQNQLTVAESQIDCLGSSLTWHAKGMHPHGDPHYQVDLRCYAGSCREGSYLLRWRCPTCNYIFNFAEDLNKIIDAVERELQENRQTDNPGDRPSSPENHIMTNPERFPFPNTEDEPDPARH
jgi:hypothetical protein